MRTLRDSEMKRNPEGRINIERLMTRLDGGMPYDVAAAAPEQCALLFKWVKDALLARVRRIKVADANSDALKRFAKYCFEHSVTCITFNYDDILDQFLWALQPKISGLDKPFWHPDGGYGFFCRPSTMMVTTEEVYKDRNAVQLLKLHGSTNWYPILGSSKPLSVDTVVHHSEWYIDAYRAQKRSFIDQIWMPLESISITSPS